MPLLSNEQIAFYRENGYLVVKRHGPKSQFKAAQDAAMRLVQRCIDIDYPYCRADARLSANFIEKVEHIFHPDIFEPEILKALIESQILDYVKEVLGNRNVFASFYRMHPTMGYSAWSSWHRDEVVDIGWDAIKATLPLFPECGFCVVPGSHKFGDPTIAADTKFKGHLPGEVETPVEAGDILLFHPLIAHRAACAGRDRYKRAQLHFRFNNGARQDMPRVSDIWSTRPELLALADDGWREVLQNGSGTSDYPVTQRKQRVGSGSTLERVAARTFYYGSALLPRDHKWMSEPPRGFVPYVRVRPEYEPMFD
jgi:ectoine hydroxylase-related dioxygenase (phytanoyl-CoA dioxygenase family)